MNTLLLMRLFFFNVADSSSSMELSTHVSSSIDWSQPITKAEESLELKWDDDEDEESENQSQKPLEMKTLTSEPTLEGMFIFLFIYFRCI